MTDTPTHPVKFAYGLDELTKLLSLGRSTLYLEARAGRLKLSKIGKRSIVLADDLAVFLNGLKQGQAAVKRDASGKGCRPPAESAQGVANLVTK